ncbi:hypothetical protein LFL96_24370 [Paraburkholderia sp. D15]|uniref:hypothetical protein n=1 Tax=Paraburkholderia sp. D15 TaxID=2880218 RepID=UPI002479698E|nr:hypothetical protein [Paraburkholderia sp. D15]WGS54167.1 hypothetical protein LFL96_24370 [Paraburkholderia sp. D15]WKF60292.1 hypothetical protein HUO10_004813 [Paraburkholderia busanensis]
MIKKNVSLVVCFAVVVLGWFCAALLCWPVLVGLKHLATATLIPHAPGTYRNLGFTSNVGLWDFPASFIGIFSIPLLDMPLGPLITLWWVTFLTMSLSFIGADRKAARASSTQQRKKRARTPPLSVAGFVKRLAIVTAVFLLLSVPCLRRYEIVTQTDIYVRDLFDLHERVYPLASLNSIRMNGDPNGRSVIVWDFGFASGQGFSTVGPDSDVLRRLLSLPGVESNVRVAGQSLRMK